MVAVRKDQAGADSFGNVWPTDGAIVDVPPHQAVILAGIPDAGCEVVDESVTARVTAVQPRTSVIEPAAGPTPPAHPGEVRMLSTPVDTAAGEPAAPPPPLSVPEPQAAAAKPGVKRPPSKTI